MQADVKQVKKEGLFRQYEVHVPKDQIDQKIDDNLAQIGKTANLKGFRPGKAPMDILRRTYGKRILGEVLEKVVGESSQKALVESKEQPAIQPSIEVVSFKEGEDLVYSMSFEIMPDFELADVAGVKLTKMTAKPEKAKMDEMLENIANMQAHAGHDHGPDGECKHDDAKPAEINDEFAQKMGFENLDGLKEMLETQAQAQLDDLSRMRLKQDLLDALDERHDFALPESMVQSELKAITQQVMQEQMAKPEEERTELSDEEKEELEGIAERRVRLGLVLSKFGEKLNVKVDNNDLQQAAVEEAKKFPGQEAQVFDYLKNNQQALESLRARAYEEKAIDAVLGTMDVADKEVKADDLTLEDEDRPKSKPRRHAAGEEGKAQSKVKVKKAPAKKEPAKKPATKKPATKKPAAKKKAPAKKKAE